MKKEKVKFFLVLILIILIYSLLSTLLLKADNSFDYKNYHTYNPFSFIQGTYFTDITAASIQTSLTTIIEIPFIFIGTISPIFMTFLLNLLQILNIIPAYLILKLYIDNKYTSLLIAFISVIGMGFLSESGTLFIDNITSIFLLFAIYFLLINRPNRSYPAYTSSLLLGITLGLKLTNIIFVIPIFLVLLYKYRKSFKTIFMSILLISLSGILVFLPYGLVNYLRWGNPFFPLLNNIFKSEYANLISFSDNRYRFKELIDFLIFPLKIAFQTHSYSEIPIGETRFIMFIIIIIPLTIFKILRNLKRRNYIFDQNIIILGSIFLIGYFLWGYLFGIYRYFIPWEILFLIIICIILIKTFKIKQYLVITFFIFYLVLNFFLLSIPNWGRSDFAETLISQNKSDHIQLNEIYNSKIIFPEYVPYEQPNAYLRLLLNNSNQIIKLSDFQNLFSDKFKKLVDDTLSDRNNSIYYITSNLGYDLNTINNNLNNWSIPYKLYSLSECNELNIKIELDPKIFYICKLN